jgi:acetyltransferase-like isoleucine patch superfamily enzyme
MRNILSAMGRVYLRFFARQARPIMIYHRKNFQGKKCKDIRISSSTVLGHKSNLLLHKNVYIGHYCRIDASNGVEIDEGVQFGSFVSIISHSSHRSIRLYGDEYTNYKDPIGYIKGPVYIGKYSFIGPHSVIAPNTKIGKGSLIKAYSYVRGDFPDFSIIAGNPAKVVGDTRESDAKILEQHPEIKPFYDAWAKD